MREDLGTTLDVMTFTVDHHQSEVNRVSSFHD